MILLRTATKEDVGLLLGWRNRPEIVALGSLNRTVSLDEHEVWFANKLASSESMIWIVQKDDVPIGQVRLDPSATREKTISVFVLDEYTGRGLGVEAIRQACELAFSHWKDLAVIKADVLSGNERSQHAFVKAGFNAVGARAGTGDMQTFRRRREIHVPHNRLTHGREERASVDQVLRSGMWAGGSKVARFEENLQEWAQVGFAVCVGSGLAGLRLALSAIGVADNIGVAVPAYSCVALPNAVLANRADPIVAEIEQGTWNIDVDKVLALADGSNVRAVIGVNTFGYPFDADKIFASGIACIEDWAHGFRLGKDGVTPAGLSSIAAIQSFYATKLIGAGEGGAVLTNSAEVAAHVRQWRDYSDQLPDATRLNDKMSDLTAAIGIEQLKKMPWMIRRRKELAERYTSEFAKHSGLCKFLSLPRHVDDRVWYRYPIYLEGANAVGLIADLRSLGVMAERPVYDWRQCGNTNCESTADKAFGNIVSLPLYPTLSVKEQNHVIKSLVNVLRSY